MAARLLLGQSRGRTHFLVLVSLLLSACAEELPPLEFEGAHVRVGTDLVPQVCGGTLTWLDYNSEYVAEQFGVEAGLSHEVYFLTPEQVREHCVSSIGCIKEGSKIFIAVSSDSDDSIQSSTVHELSHDYSLAVLRKHPRRALEEGLASAVERDYCPGNEIDVDEVLAAKSPEDLFGTSCQVGNFMGWLLESEGPEATLAFHGALGHSGPNEDVHEAYTKQFERSLSDDFALHSLEHPATHRPYKCYPEVASGTTPYRVLEADSDCANPRVEDDFLDPSVVRIKWRLDVAADEAGPWQIIGPLGSGGDRRSVFVTHDECVNPDGDASPGKLLDESDVRSRVWLGPGSHTLLVIAPRDEPQSFSMTLSGPCRFGADKCLPEHRCDGQVCTPRATDPLPLGSACSRGDDLLDPCDEGARCVGRALASPDWVDGECVALCTSDDDCPATMRCHAEGLCGTACEIGVPSCVGNRHCVQGWGGSASVCLPPSSNDVDPNLQLSDRCKSDSQCPSGEVCDRPQLDDEARDCGDFGPCECTQLCAFDESLPACPAPQVCLFDLDGRRATCQYE